MNRLRTHRLKLGAENDHNVANIASEQNKSENNNNSGNGLLNKLTKRYSTLSSKITRRTQSGRKSKSPQKAISGSYDMTGANSDDHRLEIGAPILISTTTLDTDRFDVSEARLRQIGGGIALSNSNLLSLNVAATADTKDHAPSSSSENEIYVDAVSGTPKAHKLSTGGEDDEKYESAVETTRPTTVDELNTSTLSKDNSNSSCSATDNSNMSMQSSNKESSPELLNASVKSCDNPAKRKSHELTPLSCLYELAKPKTRMSKKPYSKSAHNLHRTELRMYLQKAPSVHLDTTTADLNNCHDLPRLSELYDNSLTGNTNSEENKENSSPSPELKSKSEPNTPMNPEQRNNVLLEQQLPKQKSHFKSIDSLDIHRNLVKRRNLALNDSTNSMEESDGSKQSLTLSHNSTIADFNLKSVSCQSLNAQSLFVSIDELNEITRQINEAEEFNQEIDLEYCTHRDNLKPSERRITLLKNKNARLMNLAHNKEKLKKGWNGVKNWIGEESTKIKEVVQKQSTLQRVASSKLSLAHAECRISPSIFGSISFRNVDNQKSKTLPGYRSADVLDKSCDNIVECETEDDENNCSLKADVGEETSPVYSRPQTEVRVENKCGQCGNLCFF